MPIHALQNRLHQFNSGRGASNKINSLRQYPLIKYFSSVIRQLPRKMTTMADKPAEAPANIVEFNRIAGLVFA